MSNKQKGFTLVEMAIVMVIIALIIGSIFVGQNLVEAAKIKATVSQIEEHQAGFNVFVDKFSAFPGDFSRADTFLGAAATEIGNGDTQIGWGDNSVGGTYEGPLAWYHMRLAGLVQGDYSTGLGSNNAVPITVIPIAKIGGDGAGYHMHYDDDNAATPLPDVDIAGGTLENYLGLGLYQISGINDNDLITPRQAYDIDKKLDDSLPDSGLVRGAEKTAGAPLCFSGNPSAYVLTSESVACWLAYKLD